ncbi:MAG: primosomal protein N', partial [Chromatiales bacterium]|nr:primosomal protein N' [Chromatiales bacterium]
MQITLRVAVPVPLRRLFDYLPCDEQSIPAPGCRVWVSFGATRRLGVVVAHGSNVAGSSRKLKKIDAVVDQTPVLAAGNLDLLHWVSAYYHHPLGETLHSALPVLLRKGEAAKASRVSVWRLTEQARTLDASRFRRARRQGAIWTALLAAPQGLDRVQLAELGGDPGPALRTMTEKGWVERGETDPWSQPPQATDEDRAPTLTDEQRTAVEAVEANTDGYQCLLLDGVTGSGKTE